MDFFVDPCGYVYGFLWILVEPGGGSLWICLWIIDLDGGSLGIFLWILVDKFADHSESIFVSR